MFSPSTMRTVTAICESDGELLRMGDDQVVRLYHQDPKFGFYLVRLITRRLIENYETSASDQRPTRWAADSPLRRAMSPCDAEGHREDRGQVILSRPQRGVRARLPDWRRGVGGLPGHRPDRRAARALEALRVDHRAPAANFVASALT